MLYTTSTGKRAKPPQGISAVGGSATRTSLPPPPFSPNLLMPAAGCPAMIPNGDLYNAGPEMLKVHDSSTQCPVTMNHELQTVTRSKSNDRQPDDPNASTTKLEAGDFDEQLANPQSSDPSYTPEEERKG